MSVYRHEEKRVGLVKYMLGVECVEFTVESGESVGPTVSNVLD